MTNGYQLWRLCLRHQKPSYSWWSVAALRRDVQQIEATAGRNAELKCTNLCSWADSGDLWDSQLDTDAEDEEEEEMEYESGDSDESDSYACRLTTLCKV